VRERQRALEQAETRRIAREAAKPAPKAQPTWVKPTLVDLFKAAGIGPHTAILHASYPTNGMVCKLDNGLTVEVRNGE
jgi:hypothetical protein